MKINAYNRIRAAPIALSSIDLNKLVTALNSINDWYEGIKSAHDRLYPALEFLVKNFGYEPYNKPVYRVFPVSHALANTLQAGKAYSLQTGLANKKIQSWTTSEKAAIEFLLGPTSPKQQDVNVVVKLLAAGHEVANYRWLSSLIHQLLKQFKHIRNRPLLDALQALNSTLADLEHEDEVMMLLPEKSKVRVQRIITRSELQNIRGFK